MTKLRAAQYRNRCSVAAGDGRFVCTPERPDWFWVPSVNLLSRYWVRSLRVKRLCVESDYLPFSSVKVSTKFSCTSEMHFLMLIGFIWLGMLPSVNCCEHVNVSSGYIDNLNARQFLEKNIASCT